MGFPTPAPTPSPAPSPTSNPSPPPTPSPTPSPTPAPTTNPTAAPTFAPTEGATGTILATDYACFSATQFTTGYDFNAPASGELLGVKLVHVYGDVTCNDNDGTNWGCEDTSSGDLIMVNVLRINDDGTD